MTSRPSLSQIALALLIASAVLLAVAPLFMPDSYHWIQHTTSESASQNVDNAWIARLGFALFGVAVGSLVVVRMGAWPWPASAAHAAFALFIVLAGVASSRPWDDAIPFLEREDWVHSLAASTIGFAFAIGVLVIWLGRLRRQESSRILDLAALIASVAIPLAMFNVEDIAGILQRAMFAVAYLWYGRELIQSSADSVG